MAAEHAYKYDYDYGSPAVKNPVPKKQERPNREFKKYENPLAKRIESERAATAKTLKVASFLMAALIMFSVSAYSFYQKDASKRNYQEANDYYLLCESEHKELTAKLNALASAENIEKYAVETLGLVKVTNDKEVYLQAETGNKTVFREGQ